MPVDRDDKACGSWYGTDVGMEFYFIKVMFPFNFVSREELQDKDIEELFLIK